MNTTVSVAEAKERFDELVERAGKGDRVIIRRRGKPSLVLARQTALESNGSKGETPLDAHRQRVQQAAKKLGNQFRLTAKQERRLAVLARKNKKGALTSEERKELFDLLHEYERLTAERAQALGALLNQSS